MLEFIKGEIIETTPAYVVLRNNGLGYFINISLNTYSGISEKTECLLYVHEIVREDAYMLYGFADKKERELFRSLISVSGVGSNTARMMLSSLSPEELKAAIVQERVNVLKGIKGIGAKSAQRIIVDLKDKLEKEHTGEEIISTPDNTSKEEALSALVTLGFPKKNVEKVLENLTGQEPDLNVEALVKQALKKL
ncbi:MAG TPA: Holliday junction branch migration protein RuvA, partial [Bacteroidales bacterium]|nr:Holliday junction branch migration protein RuvA [Bacteroidales bacterium]